MESSSNKSKFIDALNTQLEKKDITAADKEKVTKYTQILNSEGNYIEKYFNQNLSLYNKYYNNLRNTAINNLQKLFEVLDEKNFRYEYKEVALQNLWLKKCAENPVLLLLNRLIPYIEASYPNENIKSALTDKTMASIRPILIEASFPNARVDFSLASYFYDNGHIEDLRDRAYFNKIIQMPANRINSDIPDINFNIDKNLSFRRLDPTNKLGYILGHLTGNCQSIGSVGEECAIYGMQNPNSGFYVLEESVKNKTPKVLAQGWAILEEVDGKKILTLDTWEMLRKSKDNLDLHTQILQHFSFLAQDKEGIAEVRVGVDSGWAKHKQQHNMGDIDTRGDSNYPNYNGYFDGEKYLKIPPKDFQFLNKTINNKKELPLVSDDIKYFALDSSFIDKLNTKLNDLIFSNQAKKDKKENILELILQLPFLYSSNLLNRIAQNKQLGLDHIKVLVSASNKALDGDGQTKFFQILIENKSSQNLIDINSICNFLEYINCDKGKNTFWYSVMINGQSISKYILDNIVDVKSFLAFYMKGIKGVKDDHFILDVFNKIRDSIDDVTKLGAVLQLVRPDYHEIVDSEAIHILDKIDFSNSDYHRINSLLFLGSDQFRDKATIKIRDSILDKAMIKNHDHLTNFIYYIDQDILDKCIDAIASRAVSTTQAGIFPNLDTFINYLNSHAWNEETFLNAFAVFTKQQNIGSKHLRNLIIINNAVNHTSNVKLIQPLAGKITYSSVKEVQSLLEAIPLESDKQIVISAVMNKETLDRILKTTNDIDNLFTNMSTSQQQQFDAIKQDYYLSITNSDPDKQPSSDTKKVSEPSSNNLVFLHQYQDMKNLEETITQNMH